MWDWFIYNGIRCQKGLIITLFHNNLIMRRILNKLTCIFQDSVCFYGITNLKIKSYNIISKILTSHHLFSWTNYESTTVVFELVFSEDSYDSPLCEGCSGTRVSTYKSAGFSCSDSKDSTFISLGLKAREVITGSAHYRCGNFCQSVKSQTSRFRLSISCQLLLINRLSVGKVAVVSLKVRIFFAILKKQKYQQCL